MKETSDAQRVLEIFNSAELSRILSLFFLFFWTKSKIMISESQLTWVGSSQCHHKPPLTLSSCPKGLVIFLLMEPTGAVLHSESPKDTSAGCRKPEIEPAISETSAAPPDSQRFMSPECAPAFSKYLFFGHIKTFSCSVNNQEGLKL